MKKFILLAIMILIIQGCKDEMLESPDYVVEHVIEKALDIPFRNYKNITATSGDFMRRMESRYKLFKSYLTKKGREEFKDKETYWRYINEVIDHQCSLILQSVTFDVRDTDNENERTYFFTAVVLIEYENDNSSVEVIQYGTAKLIKSGKKWGVDSLEYDNHIFDENN